MGNNSFFTGVGALIDNAQSGKPLGALNKQLLVAFPAQVLDVDLDSKNPLDIGRIRFRNLITNKNISESSINDYASVLDRSMARYPLPGEEVIVFNVPGQIDVYFYTSVVAINHNTTSNVEPSLGGDYKGTYLKSTTSAEAKANFDKKLKDPNLINDATGTAKVYNELRPREGDFILQGRFGTGIRFGSTAANQDKGVISWSDNESGVSGDGIITIRADRGYTTKPDDMYKYEDVNNDDSSVYICTSQTIKLNMACSSNLKSWAARFNLLDNK